MRAAAAAVAVVRDSAKVVQDRAVAQSHSNLQFRREADGFIRSSVQLRSQADELLRLAVDQQAAVARLKLALAAERLGEDGVAALVRH